MMKQKWIVLVALLFVQSSWAGRTYPEHVRVIDPDKKFLKQLSKNPDIIIDHVDSLGYEMYGPAGITTQLTQMGVQHFPEPKIADDKTAENYPSPEEIIQQMNDLQKKYPTLIQLIEIGKSVEKRPLMFAKLTAPSSVGAKMADRPEFKYVANMHGDEIAGRELMIRLIEDLASNYGKDQRITQLMNSVQIYIMPSMNPDGANRKVRFNAHNVDLNRSFPDFTTSDNVNSSQNREPEVEAMMKFQAQHQFKLSANFHGGSEVVNYPWDTTADPFPLENLVKQLSLDYSKRVSYLYNSTEFKQGITNGYAWYEVDGGMQDWSYHWHNDLQITVELTRSKWPRYSSIAKTYQDNRDALLAYIEDIFQVN